MVTSSKGDVPKVSVNGPDGTSVAAQAQSPPHSSTEQSPAPPSSGSVSNPTDKVYLFFLLSCALIEFVQIVPC